MLYHIILSLCIGLQFVITKTIDDFAVVIDAGSTGSRCFVFHIVLYSTIKNKYGKIKNPTLLEALDNSYNDHRNISAYTCGKVIPGLSAFAEHPNDASAYIAPLLNIAASRIPIQYHYKTQVFIKATAGLRLLSDSKQQRLWHKLVQGLMQRDDMPFIINKDSVGTIDGHDEAFFAVLASNYIAGSIDGNLQ